MTPVYSLEDIDGFKPVLAAKKDYIMATPMTRSELDAYLRKIRKEYYKTCTPIGYI